MQRKAEVKILGNYGNTACVKLEMRNWKSANLLWKLTLETESKQYMGINCSYGTAGLIGFPLLDC